MKDTNRIVWADFLCLIAILMVICIHCADPFNVSPEARSNPEYNFWGSIYGAFLRPCVPLFVMLTGMLLLPVREETGPFYKKRMMRVLVPFVVWSFLYTIFPWLTGLVGLDSSILTRMFAYAGESPSQSLGDSLHNLWMIPFNFHTYTVHLWYIYMLLGLYLYLPFFSAWVKQASKKQIRIFLGLWCITLFLPYCREFLSENLGGTCAWNDFGILYYFSGFCGYLLLGSYLKDTGNRLSAGKTVGLSIILFAVGYAVTYDGFREMTARLDATERQVELFFLYCSPNVMMMTVAVWLLAQKVKITSAFLVRALANLTRCGLGIYLIHYFLVGTGYLVVDNLGLPVPLRVPVTALLVFTVAWGLVAGCYRAFPRAARWVMG